MLNKLTSYFNTETSAAPLAVFRIGFGIMMLASIIRFWSYGWIEKLYIEPKFHFSYYGFEWIKPVGNYTYFIFIICGLSALFVALGFKYRLAIITFFLSFTYIELMDKTTYLNHYYFISVLSLLLCFLPANAYFSLDAIRRKKQYTQIPKWTIDSIKLLLGLVYVYAGLAKINSDWLLKAMPLKIWLPSKYDLPFIGDSILQQEWFHIAMSWSGMLYDLSIPFLLLYKRTRIFAFVLVVFFHIFTRVLFPIGMFPYVMIVGTLIFFDAKVHERILNIFRKLFQFFNLKAVKLKASSYSFSNQKIILPILALFFAIQLLLPFRYVLYPNELFWTEEGYRFSWRVMLMEKAGYTEFKVVDAEAGHSFSVNNSGFLTTFQEKQMSTQPDFILEYAQFLEHHFKSQGHQNIEIYVDSYVALNGRSSQRYIDPKVDLLKQNESFKPKNWILPFKDEIKGL
ncbi:HTTM domain-containing protein [Winogradskyella bathintestinalis]|uniref:HTTM domain-containing protein n=1 Tax=Winogradskyella bathintestinalis TaxID=3035208 RepID=A0ABT7ZXB7_9FLAO|nr:HTTM domain-containing protein [Winogradskyella bathintestinalis]MDN3493656.1 HTTM domain-containing protein [Winogradskyella bathintestinalis]